MELLTDVAGDPVACEESARSLVRLAAALDDNAAAVRRAGRTPQETFSGEAATGFHGACQRLTGHITAIDSATNTSARALQSYGDRLAEVQQVMARARRVARSHELLHGSTIRLPGSATPLQRETFLGLGPIVNGAWAVLRDAESDLRAAAERAFPGIVNGSPLDFYPLSGVPAGAKPPVEPPTPWPPVEGDWPDDAGYGPTGSAPPPEPTPAPDGRPHHVTQHHATPHLVSALATATATALALPLTVRLAPTPGVLMNTDHDVTVAVPRHWATRSDPEQGIVAAARARETPPSGFPPEVVVRSVPVDAPLEAWREGALGSLSTHLEGFEVEDSDEFELGGQPVVYHRFTHRLGTTDVVCDQWSWVVDGVGVTMTGSVAREDYAAWCDLFEDVAATVEISPRAAA